MAEMSQTGGESESKTPDGLIIVFAPLKAERGRIKLDDPGA